MKNNIYNPLFESLLKKVNDYENPQGISEQDGAVKGTIFSDYMKGMSQLGAKLVAQYANAIQTYPKTAIKTEYMKTFTDKLKAIENSIDITKTPSIQLDGLFNNVKTEATAFFGLGAKEDKRLTKHLEPWRDSFRTGFQLYTQAFKSLMEYVKKQEESGQAKISETEKGMMKAGVSKFIASLTASFEKNKTITDTKWGEPVVGESLVRDNSVIERLIQNKICVDFNTFNTVINEAKEDRVARRASKAIRPKIESLQANISNVLNQIGGRLGDPAKANFKSLAMAPEFNKIANTLVSIQDELSIDQAELKNVQFDDLNKQVDNLVDLFNSKKESYDKTYSEEEKTLRSSKTLEIATPEVAKFIADGDAQFDALSDLAQKGANLFSADIEKEKQDKSQADKLKGESQPKNPGKKDGEIQKGQDGADWKWDAKAKVWNKVEVADTVSTSDIKLASPLKKGAKGDQVKAVQQLIIDKMGTKLKDVPQYKKFAKYGADGIFGGSTASLVPAIKGGLGLKDTSSDITQELVDKLSAVIKESFVFEQDFDMDAFNKIIGSGGGGNSGPRKVTKEDISKSKEALKDASKEIAKEKPKLAQEEVKKQIDDAIGKAKEEWDKESAIKELKTLGAIPNPNYGKDGQMAVATVNGMRFYSNGVALRQFDSMMGTYNVAKDEFIGNDGSKDKITTLMKTAIPFKFSNAFSQFQYNPAKACKDYKGWSAGTVSILNKAFKITYKKTLDKHLANKLSTWYGSVNDDVDAFRKKFASVIS
jgi:hypothetical protein